MSVKVMALIWKSDLLLPKLRMLLLAIADNANSAGMAFPGINLLAAKTCVNKRTVIRQLEALREGGWIMIESRSSGKGRKGNTYYLNLEKLGSYDSECAGTKATPARRSVAGGRHDEQTTTASGVTKTNDQVTKAHFSGDKTASPILINHQEPSQEPSGGIPYRSLGSASRSESNSERLRLASAMLENLYVIPTPKLVHLAGQSIRLLSKRDRCTPGQAAMLIEERARAAKDHGKSVNAFWFEDGKWDEMPSSPASVGLYRRPVLAVTKSDILNQKRPDAPSAQELEHGERCWTTMKTSMKQAMPPGIFDTWVRYIRPLGLTNGVMTVELPSEAFVGADGRYEFHKYLPGEVSQLRCVVAGDPAA